MPDTVVNHEVIFVYDFHRLLALFARLSNSSNTILFMGQWWLFQNRCLRYSWHGEHEYQRRQLRRPSTRLDYSASYARLKKNSDFSASTLFFFFPIEIYLNWALSCMPQKSGFFFTNEILLNIPYLLGISTIGGQASKLSQSETKHPEKEQCYPDGVQPGEAELTGSH